MLVILTRAMGSAVSNVSLLSLFSSVFLVSAFKKRKRRLELGQVMVVDDAVRRSCVGGFAALADRVLSPPRPALTPPKFVTKGFTLTHNDEFPFTKKGNISYSILSCQTQNVQMTASLHLKRVAGEKEKKGRNTTTKHLGSSSTARRVEVKRAVWAFLTVLPAGAKFATLQTTSLKEDTAPYVFDDGGENTYTVSVCHAVLPDETFESYPDNKFAGKFLPNS